MGDGDDDVPGPDGEGDLGGAGEEGGDSHRSGIPGCEGRDASFAKIDLLALPVLDQIEEALDWIEERRGSGPT